VKISKKRLREASYVLIWGFQLRKTPAGFALGGLAGYGLGRFWLEPLGEARDLVFGRVRINEVIAACLRLAAVGGLFLLNLTSIRGRTRDSQPSQRPHAQDSTLRVSEVSSSAGGHRRGQVGDAAELLQIPP